MKASIMLPRRCCHHHEHRTYCGRRRAESRLGCVYALVCKSVHGRVSFERLVLACRSWRLQDLGAASTWMTARWKLLPGTGLLVGPA